MWVETAGKSPMPQKWIMQKSEVGMEFPSRLWGCSWWRQLWLRRNFPQGTSARLEVGEGGQKKIFPLEHKERIRWMCCSPLRKHSSITVLKSLQRPALSAPCLLRLLRSRRSGIQLPLMCRGTLSKCLSSVCFSWPLHQFHNMKMIGLDQGCGSI